MHKYLVIRISFGTLAVTSSLFWPFYLTTVLLVCGVFYFTHFYEGLVFTLIIDALYGTAAGIWGIPFVCFFGMAGLLFAVYFLKKELRSNKGSPTSLI